MGTTFLLVAASDDEHLLADAVAQIAELESRWSRFLVDSEISVLNRAQGAPVIVSSDTFHVIQAAVDGAIQTEGRFDPTVHDSMVALGYDRTFDDIRGSHDGMANGDAVPAPGVAGIELDESLLAVRLPRGVAIDLGGIGKGAAADLVSDSVMTRGAAGIAVSIGGDVRVRGDSPSGSGWRFEGDTSTLPMPALRDGGVCTSSVRRRRWRTRVGAVHHVVDPRTGESTSGAIESVTVIGASALQAEVLTKAAMVADYGAPALLERFGVASHISWRNAS